MANKKTQQAYKPIYKRWWFWLVLVVYIAIIFTIGINHKNNNNNDSSTGSKYNFFSWLNKESSSKNKTYGIGDVVVAGKSQIKVTSVRYNYIGDMPEYFHPKDGSEWVKVYISQTNNSSSKLDFNALYWKIKDGDGVINGYLNTSLGAQDDDFLSSGDLAPGGTKNGSIVFEVPSGDRNLTIIYNPTFEYGAYAEIKL